MLAEEAGAYAADCAAVPSEVEIRSRWLAEVIEARIVFMIGNGPNCRRVGPVFRGTTTKKIFYEVKRY